MKTALQKLSPHWKKSKPYEDPTTMEKSLPKSIYNDEEEVGDNDPLQKQLKTLEQEWDCIKQSISISRSNRRNSTTDSIATFDHPLFQIHEKSPKELMALLQHDSSPSEEEFLNSRQHDRVAVEIIKEREADFDNGRFKGRRLFEESDEDESEVCTEFSYKALENRGGKYAQLMDAPQCDVAERDVVVMRVKSGGGGCSVRRWMICVVVMVFAFGIFAFKCSGEDEQILVPT